MKKQGKEGKRGPSQGSNRPTKRFWRGQHGFTLVEVLVAVFMLAVVGTIGLLALAAATQSRVQSDMRTTAVSLANSIMETVKGNATEYQIVGDTDADKMAEYSSVLTSISIPDGYQIYSDNKTGGAEAGKIYGLPWNIKPTPTSSYNKPVYNQTNPTDPGIQKVTVIVQYNNEEIFRLADFKVDR